MVCSQVFRLKITGCTKSRPDESKDFKSVPPVQFYAELGYNFKINRK